MNGYVTEYTPGTDHAGISTQVQFLSRLLWKNKSGKKNKKLDTTMAVKHSSPKYGNGKKGTVSI